MNECVCAVTGHRPSRFKFKYSEDYALCKKIKANMLEVFRKLHDEKEVRRFYVGGALGVDMWATTNSISSYPGCSFRRRICSAAHISTPRAPPT